MKIHGSATDIPREAVWIGSIYEIVIGKPCSKFHGGGLAAGPVRGYERRGCARAGLRSDTRPNAERPRPGPAPSSHLDHSVPGWERASKYQGSCGTRCELPPANEIASLNPAPGALRGCGYITLTGVGFCSRIKGGDVHVAPEKMRFLLSR